MKSTRIVIVVFCVVMFFVAWTAKAEEKTSAKAKGRVVTIVPSITKAGTNAVPALPANAPALAKINAEFMRKVMEASARIEAMKKEIEERENEIYRTNSEIKALQTQMIELQKTINEILDSDKELAEIKMKRDILWTTMPSLPKSNDRAFPPNLMRTKSPLPLGVGKPLVVPDKR